MPTAELFHPKVALITGASAGFGQEFARQLAPLVSELHLVARRADRLEEMKRELEHAGLTVRTYAVDLTDATAVERFLGEFETVSGELDLLVNNAGMGDHGKFAESEWSKVDAMLKLNISALTQLTHALLPRLRKARQAAILNVSSIAAFVPLPGMTVYAATKAYVSSFTEGLRGELRGTGVRVTGVNPGPVDTEFFARAERPGYQPMKNAELMKISPEQVVREALWAVRHDRARTVPGWLPWVLAMAVLALPLWLLRPFLAKRA